MMGLSIFSLYSPVDAFSSQFFHWFHFVFVCLLEIKYITHLAVFLLLLYTYFK